MPVTGGGRIAALVVRVAPNGVVLLHFFNRQLTNAPSTDDLQGLRATDSILTANVVGVPFAEGEWQFIGHHDNWTRLGWPVPMFSMCFGFNTELRARKVTMAEDGFTALGSEPCSVEEARRLPDANPQGGYYIESRLASILSNQNDLGHLELGDDTKSSSEASLTHFAYFDDERMANACKDMLERENRHVSISRSVASGKWLLQVVETSLEESKSAEDSADEIEAITQECGGEYDGLFLV